MGNRIADIETMSRNVDAGNGIKMFFTAYRFYFLCEASEL
jgi:hypothetical protein